MEASTGVVVVSAANASLRRVCATTRASRTPVLSKPNVRTPRSGDKNDTRWLQSLHWTTSKPPRDSTAAASAAASVPRAHQAVPVAAAAAHAPSSSSPRRSADPDAVSSDGRVRSVLSCQDCSNDTVVEYVFDEILSCMVCPECGVCQPFFETTTGTMSQTNQRMEMTSFGYEPILHFRERLTYTQAKEQHRVPDKIVTDVMAVLAQDFTHSRALQPKDTMRALNKLKLPHYYRNNPQIFCRITGTKPPRLTRADERRYLDLFRQLIRPYDQCKGDRTNFMSYPYALYRISERLGHKEFLPFCLLFKTYKHLKKTDDIFANMCRMLGWDTDQFALYAPGNNTRHVPAHHAKKRPRTSSTAPRGASKKQKHSGQGSNL